MKKLLLSFVATAILASCTTSAPAEETKTTGDSTTTTTVTTPSVDSTATKADTTKKAH